MAEGHVWPYTDLMREVHREFPDFTIVRKTKENVPKWLWWVFVIAGWVNKDFFTRYATVVGTTIYFPSERSSSPASMDALIRHERVHMRDAKVWKALYYVSYVIPPVYWTLRAHWELRAYAQTLLVWWEQYQERAVGPDVFPLEDEDWLVGVLTGPGYWWMCMPEKRARRKVRKLMARVTSGEASGRDWPHRPLDDTALTP